MEIKTVNFGKIEIDENKIINFPEGILGFEDYQQFTIIDNLDDDVFCWLQSLDDPQISFMMINPLDFVEGYQVEINDKFLNKLALKDEKDVLVYTLVVIGDNGDYISTNLKAPIIINTAKKLAGQLVLGEDYPTRYYLYQREAAV